jgi:hypothetical protein
MHEEDNYSKAEESVLVAKKLEGSLVNGANVNSYALTFLARGSESFVYCRRANMQRLSSVVLLRLSRSLGYRSSDKTLENIEQTSGEGSIIRFSCRTTALIWLIGGILPSGKNGLAGLLEKYSFMCRPHSGCAWEGICSGYTRSYSAARKRIRL